MRQSSYTTWAFVLIAASHAAHAQDLGVARVEAGVSLVGVYTDNFYYDPESTGTATAAQGALVAPRVGFKSSSGSVDLNLGLDGELGAFSAPGAADDYVDARGVAAMSAALSGRSRVDADAGFQRGHDPFGTNRTENAAVHDTELDVWNRTTASGSFHYGAPGARLNGEVGLSFNGRSYQANRDATAFLDSRTTSAEGTVFYNIGPKTEALLQLIDSQTKYPTTYGPGDDRDANEVSARVGTRWTATQKTSADVRVGYYQRTFDRSGETDSGLDWAVGLRWQAMARAAFSVDTARSSQDSYRQDTRVNSTRSFSAGWTEDWTSRTRTELRIGEIHTRFVGAGRSDDLYNAGLGLNYVLTQYLVLLASVDTFKRDSNDPSATFSRLTSYLGLRYSR